MATIISDKDLKEYIIKRVEKYDTFSRVIILKNCVRHKNYDRLFIGYGYTETDYACHKISKNQIEYVITEILREM